MKPTFPFTLTKLSGKRPLFPFSSPSIQPSSSMCRTFLMMSPGRSVSSSSWSASYSYSTRTSAWKKGKKRAGEKFSWEGGKWLGENVAEVEGAQEEREEGKA